MIISRFKGLDGCSLSINVDLLPNDEWKSLFVGNQENGFLQHLWTQHDTSSFFFPNDMRSCIGLHVSSSKTQRDMPIFCWDLGSHQITPLKITGILFSNLQPFYCLDLIGLVLSMTAFNSGQSCGCPWRSYTHLPYHILVDCMSVNSYTTSYSISNCEAYKLRCVI